ncbi:MAG TPA: 4-(cytidine 5'-diphospho)-2-C-methyl-D-erythritol kinase [Fibrobacteraceae bacterium]|jgi:4-diphosphocytidyl-2-C-methyl-D-erythritol kinase|nr:4-(cytidine 5'-diphospho)-2-C-methyl-D-erythritol kinase [Fibrobacteraceae bacterium]
MIEKEYAPAKINLFLDILRKRPDGYHDLGTAFQTVDAGDTLEASLRKDSEITLSYNAKQDYPIESDLVYKAAHLLQSTYKVSMGVDLYLSKIMPIGAGLGGGSADAAAALRLLNRLWGLSLSSKELELLAVRLGADVPFLIDGGLSFAEGIGEKLTPMPPLLLPESMALLIATPQCAVPTKAAYAGVKPSGDDRWDEWKSKYDSSVMPELFNKFEESVLPQFPLIAEMKKDFLSYGAIASLMSGSGASVFGFFENRREADLALSKLGNRARWATVTTFLKKM